MHNFPLVCLNQTPGHMGRGFFWVGRLFWIVWLGVARPDMIALIPLGFLVRGMTRLTPFRIFRVSPFSEVLLSSPCKHELFATLTADQDLWIKTVFHNYPLSFLSNPIHGDQNYKYNIVTSGG